MGRNDTTSEVKSPPRPVKQARQRRGRNKAHQEFNFKPQVITFSCIFCNQTFENTNILFDHMRRVHPNLCDIPQITADSEIVEEISGNNNNNNCSKEEVQKSRGSPSAQPTSVIVENKCNSGEDNSVDHLIEMVGSDEEMVFEEEEAEVEDDEEIESPPYETNSDAGGSNFSEPVRDEQQFHPREKVDEDLEKVAENFNEEETDDEGDDYLSLMEPICEIRNCDDVEAETKLQESINKGEGVVGGALKTGRGRRSDLSEAANLESDSAAGEGFFQCTVCNKSFPYAGELARHVRSHTLNKPYQCSICDKSFTHIGSLNTHLRIHTGVKPYQCSICSKAFTQSSSLMVHLRSHQSKKPLRQYKDGVGANEELLPCPKCDKKFKHETILNEHLKVHEESDLYQCSICRKQFPTGSELVQHLKFHTGDKPFQCSICGKSFTQPGSLSTHTRTHTGERPHSCPHPDCDKKFTQASSLSVHMKIHSPEKQFWCHICQRSYSQQAYFNKHMSYHQQDKFAPCPLCNAVIFDAGKQLVKHFNKFHYDKQDKMFLCSICNVRYEDPQLLIDHVKIHFQGSNAAPTSIEGGFEEAKL